MSVDVSLWVEMMDVLLGFCTHIQQQRTTEKESGADGGGAAARKVNKGNKYSSRKCIEDMRRVQFARAPCTRLVKHD